jgi:hypothetical protein
MQRITLRPMTDTLLLLLPTAIGIALSPIAIVEMILVLFSNRARTNGLVFLLSIMSGVFLVPAVGTLAFDAAVGGSGEAVSSGKAGVMIVLGVLLLLFAFRNWQQRTDRSTPAVFGTIAGMGPGAVLFLSLGVTVLNPKNLVLLLSAGATVGASGLEPGAVLITLVIFTLTATLPFSLAVIYLFAGGEAAQARLELIKEMLLARNKLIMAVVVGILGLVVIGEGLAALL